MFKATMRDTLGWMKDTQVITGSVVALITFINTYDGLKNQDVNIENIMKLNECEECVIKTIDGLKITVKNK